MKDEIHGSNSKGSWHVKEQPCTYVPLTRAIETATDFLSMRDWDLKWAAFHGVFSRERERQVVIRSPRERNMLHV